MISAVGAGMNQTAALETFARETDPDLFLLAGRYTLLEQGALDTFLPLCEQRGIAVIVGGAYNSGLLADPNPGTHYNYLPAPQPLIDRAQQLQAICTRHDVPLKAAAIQFPAAHPVVAAVLTGSRRATELTENFALFDRPIPAELWTELRAAGCSTSAPRCPLTNPVTGLTVDAHHHLWDPAQGEYPWMSGEFAPLRRDIRAGAPGAGTHRARVQATVVVQVRADVSETEDLLALTTRHPFLAGVVGWVDLTSAQVDAAT